MNTTIEEIQSMIGVLYIQLQIAHKENEALKAQIQKLEGEKKEKEDGD